MMDKLFKYLEFGKVLTQKAFLHNEALSAHPEEEEVLLYAGDLRVKDI